MARISDDRMLLKPCAAPRACSRRTRHGCRTWVTTSFPEVVGAAALTVEPLGRNARIRVPNPLAKPATLGRIRH
jgi:hypothetical protein